MAVSLTTRTTGCDCKDIQENRSRQSSLNTVSALRSPACPSVRAHQRELPSLTQFPTMITLPFVQHSVTSPDPAILLHSSQPVEPAPADQALSPLPAAPRVLHRPHAHYSLEES